MRWCTSVHPPIYSATRRTRRTRLRAVSAGGEEAADGAGAGGLPAQVELVVDVLQVPLDGADAEGELGGDRGVVVALGGEGEHLDLARGEDRAEVASAGTAGRRLASARNSVTSRRKTGQAGSSSSTMWLSLSSGDQAGSGDVARRGSARTRSVHPVAAASGCTSVGDVERSRAGAVTSASATLLPRADGDVGA